MHCSHCGRELHAQGSFCTQCGAPNPTEAERFTWAARQMSRLVARRRAGELDDTAFSEARGGFMIHDDTGRSWVPNSDGSWYCHEGTDWVMRQPPVSVEEPAITEVVSPLRAAPSLRSRSQSRPVSQPAKYTGQSTRNAGQPAQKKKEKKRKRGLVMRAVLGLLVLLVACGAWWAWSLVNDARRAIQISPSPTDFTPTLTVPTQDLTVAFPTDGLTLRDTVEVLSEMVDSSGSTITIDEPASPIDGLAIRVPEGAYSEETEFEVNYTLIEEHVLGDDVTALTPLISVENGGDYSEEYMIVTTPASIPEGHFAMPFYYDEETGNFEGIPVVDHDNDSLTMVTRHFSAYTLLSIEKEKLEHLDIKTGFTLGEDDWNVVNAGSYMVPQGFCRGMTMSAIWYYFREKPVTGEGLWKQSMNGLGAGRETPNFWQDDSWAIQLCSTIQAKGGTLTDSIITDLIETRYGIQSSSTPNRNSFYSLAFAMYVSDKLVEEGINVAPAPQVMGVYGTYLKTGSTSGHVLICYRIKDNVLHVADPNMPGKPNPFTPTIIYDDKNGQEDGAFSRYSSAQSVKDLMNNNLILYTRVRFRGISYADDMIEIGRMWLNAENGQCQSPEEKEPCFPDYTLRLIGEDENGNPFQVELDPVEGATVHQKSVDVQLEGAFAQARVAVYDSVAVMEYEDKKKKDPNNESIRPPSAITLSDHALKPGDNLLGFYVQAKTDEYQASDGRIIEEWSWAGFDWINVVYEEQETAPSTTTKFTPATGDLSIDECDACKELKVTVSDPLWRASNQQCTADVALKNTGTRAIIIYGYNEGHDTGEGLASNTWDIWVNGLGERVYDRPGAEIWYNWNGGVANIRRNVKSIVAYYRIPPESDPDASMMDKTELSKINRCGWIGDYIDKNGKPPAGLTVIEVKEKDPCKDGPSQ